MITQSIHSLLGLVLLASLPSAPVHAEGNHDKASDAEHHMIVYKSPTCGCCSGWVDYMRREGFDVETVDTDDVDSIKSANGLVRDELKSCHTALIDGYVIEGHVPASDVRRLLEQRPDVAGLTAPGMPMMSPGMGSENPQGYSVLTFRDDGAAREFSIY